MKKGIEHLSLFVGVCVCVGLIWSNYRIIVFFSLLNSSSSHCCSGAWINFILEQKFENILSLSITLTHTQPFLFFNLGVVCIQMSILIITFPFYEWTTKLFHHDDSSFLLPAKKCVTQNLSFFSLSLSLCIYEFHYQFNSSYIVHSFIYLFLLFCHCVVDDS